MGDFPSQVNVAQAPAIAGDFASKNPRYSVLAGPGAFIAGPAGVTVGRFAWASGNLDGDGAPGVVNNFGFGLPSGFVHRAQQSLITAYLAASGNLIAPGFGMTLMSSGDFWVKNDGLTEASYGEKAYANFADGKVSFAATGAPLGGGTSTASTLAAGTNSFTGVIADDQLTTSAVTGTIAIGTLVAGTGVPDALYVTAQLSGVAGGAGVYQLSIGGLTVASVAMTGTYGILTIGGTVAGTFGVGQAVTGSGVTAGMSITQLGTGTGAAGTYFTNVSQVLSSQAINTSSNIETKYFCRSSGLPGEIVKISPTPNA